MYTYCTKRQRGLVQGRGILHVVRVSHVITPKMASPTPKVNFSQPRPENSISHGGNFNWTPTNNAFTTMSKWNTNIARWILNLYEYTEIPPSTK